MTFVDSLLAIFAKCLLPVFALIGIGWLVQRRLGLEMRTLTRLNLWIFVPAVVLDRLSKSTLSVSVFGKVLLMSAALMVAMYALAWLWCRLRGYSVKLRSAFLVSTLFYNSGNYGLPVIELVFGAGSQALALQTFVLAWQNITTFSLGQVIIRGPSLGVRRAFVEYLKMPFLYAICVGLFLQQTGRVLPGPLDNAVTLIAAGMVPVALITLGAQLGQVKWQGHLRPVLSASAMRLLIGPALVFVGLKALGWNGLLAQHLLVSSSFPSAVNGALLAIEFDNEPDFAAQAVMLATLLSAVTVALTIYVAQVAFPL